MPARHEPTKESRRTVRNLALAGTQQEIIAKAIGVTKPTLRRHYREELTKYGHVCTGNVAAKLYGKAMRGDTTAMIFWLKTRAGWKEGMEIDHSSKDGSMSAPRTVEVVGFGGGKK